MYRDKLDGKISEEFYKGKSDEQCQEQQEIRRKLEAHEKANVSYMKGGINPLDLAEMAYLPYSRQFPEEKRRLLKFVLSNCHYAKTI
ncbi:MAG: hypothetical protein J7M18_06540 [Candidatus Eremiobacteraeota bacterium]|nr:hypothetical protein [Candidatus Eremiobacteraeota bacterium]